MKAIAPVIIASAASAMLAVVVYSKVHKPDTIVVHESLPVSYVSDGDGFLSAPAGSGIMPAGTPTDFVNAAHQAKRAVVSIRSQSRGSFWRNENFGSNSGSGVIISPDGYIATNSHVIDDGNKITVQLSDQREFKADVIGSDPSTDIALLKIDTRNLPAIRFGNSDSVFVGEWVLAIGSPFRLQSTVTAGIVSAKGRNIDILPDQTGIESFIQTDAAVNPGNSGGALVNTDGELIGINTAIITYSGQYEGFSFAVPSNLVAKVLDDLRQYGSVRRGWMGVAIRSVDAPMADLLGLEKVAGVYIDSVTDRSAAEAAGLEPGDVIVTVDGKQTTGTSDFMEFVGQHRPGDKLRIGYIREGAKRNTTVVLSESRNSTAHFTSRNYRSDQEILEDLGIDVRELTEKERNRLQTDGVIVEHIEKGSTIAETNMEKEYVITRVNGQSVTSIADLASSIRNHSGVVVLEGIYEKFPGDYPYMFKID